MSESDQQKLYQVTGIITLSERFLDDWETLTRAEVESIQQTLSAAKTLLSQLGEEP